MGKRKLLHNLEDMNAMLEEGSCLLYGAGRVARSVVKYASQTGYLIEGILVSDTGRNPYSVMGVPVCTPEGYPGELRNRCLIVAVLEDAHGELEAVLSKYRFEEIAYMSDLLFQKITYQMGDVGLDCLNELAGINREMKAREKRMLRFVPRPCLEYMVLNKEWGEQAARYKGNRMGPVAFMEDTFILSPCFDIPYFHSRANERWTPIILQFDLTQRKMENFVLPETVRCMVCCGRKLYFACADTKKILVWDTAANTLDSHKNTDAEAGCYFYGIPFGNGAAFMDDKSVDIFENGEFLSIPHNFKRVNTRPKVPLFSFCVEWNRHAVMLPYGADIILKIDKRNMAVHEYVATLPCDADTMDYLAEKRLLSESDLGLEDYIKAVGAGKQGKPFMRSGQSIGKDIMERIKQEFLLGLGYERRGLYGRR